MRVVEVASHKGLQQTSGRGFWRESGRHGTLFSSKTDLPSQTKMEASGEGNFFVSTNTSSSAPFQEERLGLGLYPGECKCKNSNGDARPIFLGLKFGQILFFLGGGVENWCYCFRLCKATARSTFSPAIAM